jgi:flagellar hook-associated protein 1
VSGLFGALSAATRALEAQRYGLEVTGQNIANVNTPGYARREAILRSVAPTDPSDAGGGVDVVGVRATRDRMLERRLQMERPAEQRDAAIADALSVVQVAVGQPGESIDARLSAFFDAVSRLADDPTSSTARQETVQSGQSLAAAFRDMSTRLTGERRSIDTQVRGTVDEVNSLATRYATLNDALAQTSADSSTAMQLRDEQKVVLDRLTELVDVQSVARSDGGTDLSIGSGRPLVIGAVSHALTASPTPPEGLFAISTDEGADLTGEVSGGRLGGYLQVRDVSIPGYLGRLDALAYQVAVEFNKVHEKGYDAGGGVGGDFFVAPTAVAGAAAAFTVDPDLADNPSLIAAAGVPASGDNQNARALANLRDARVMNGGQATMIEAWSQLVYRIGSDTQAAQQEQQSRAEIVSQVEALTDAVSGVSLDEEAMMMMRFQRAYEANARFFQAVNQSIDTLMGMLAT